MSGSIDDATLAEIEAELISDGVWVDPAFARQHQISAEDEARIEEVVAAAEQSDPRVVLAAVQGDDDRFQGSFASLSAWLHDDLGGDATYLGWEQYGQEYVRVETFGDQPDAAYVGNVAGREHPDDLAEQVIEALELLESGQAREIWQEIPLDERYPNSAGSGGDGPSYLPIVGGLVLAAAVVVGVLRWRRRRPDAGFALPAAVLRTVRAAEDRQLRQRAEQEVLALGEALGGDRNWSQAAASLAARQAALDHYQAARAVLDRAGSPADVVGALVLARRGDDARRHASTGGTRTWQPPTGCYFNPLHDGPVTPVSWDAEGRSATVPACGDCAAAVQRGEEPDDVLDFVESDRPVHYYRLDLGPWSSTGYGTLEPDLLGALLGSGRRQPRRGLRGRGSR